jgi:transcriptional regulatory protein LevR
MYFFPFSISFNFSCNPMRCQIRDFDMIFITLFLKSNRVSADPHSPQKKILVAPMHSTASCTRS